MRVMSRFALAALVAMLSLHSAAGAPVSSSPASPDKSVAIIRLSGEVDDFTRDVLFRHFREAEAAGTVTDGDELARFAAAGEGAFLCRRFFMAVGQLAGPRQSCRPRQHTRKRPQSRQ